LKSQHFLLMIFIFLGYWMARIYEPFLQNIVIASLLAISTSKLNKYTLRWLKNELIVSIFLTISLGIMFFVPLVYFLTNIATYVNSIDKSYIVDTFKYLTDIVNDIPDTVGFLKPALKEFLDEINISNSISKIFGFTASLGKSSVGFVRDMILILILYLFANIYGKRIIVYFKGIIPLNDLELDELFNKVSNVMGVVFYSILITAVLEGFLFGIVITYIGFDGFLFGVLYGFASLIPIIGGIIMWLPVTIYEVLNGNYVDALIVSLYSIIVISIIADTFIKPFIIKYLSERILKIKNAINELLIFFAIVAGLSTFGFWGMIIGPAVTALFISILKLNKKLQELE